MSSKNVHLIYLCGLASSVYYIFDIFNTFLFSFTIRAIDLFQCPRADKKCFDSLDKDYKFYLAFENSNCRDYVTEKFFVNGLGRNVLPIVMGARPEDYQRSAPEGKILWIQIQNVSIFKYYHIYLFLPLTFLENLISQRNLVKIFGKI